MSEGTLGFVKTRTRFFLLSGVKMALRQNPALKIGLAAHAFV